MAYKYRLSRRLALSHISLAAVLTLACSDTTTDPESLVVNDVEAVGVPEAGTPSDALALEAVTTALTNEPIGFSQINTRIFNAKVESGWRTRNDPEFSIIQSSLAPKSPNGIGKAFYPIGMKGGVAPINTWYVLPTGKTELYVSFWIKFSTNWNGHLSTCNKILNFWIGGNNRVVLKGQAAGSKPLKINVKMQNVAMSPSAFDLDPNQSTLGILKRGQWHQVEFVVRANTANNFNGSMSWWVDGQAVANHNNLRFVVNSQDHTWYQITWNPVWGGAGGVLDRNQDMQIDHMYISGR